jgi:hypothetical protein
MQSPDFFRTPISAAAAEAARVRFIRYCRDQGWDWWGLWLAMGYEDDWLASLTDDEGAYVEDPPPLPMPTVAELRRGALYLGVSVEQLLTEAWGVSAASLADDDSRAVGSRLPRRFGQEATSSSRPVDAWPGGSSATPDATSAWEASIAWHSMGRGDLVHRVCNRIGEAIVALGVAPAYSLDNPWKLPELRVRAASRNARSVTIGLDGELLSLARVDTHLGEIVSRAFGSTVQLERGSAGIQPGMTFCLTVQDASANWSLLGAADTEPENQPGSPAPWPRFALAPLGVHAHGQLFFVNWQQLPPLRVDLEATETAPDHLTTLVGSVLAGQNPRETDVLLLGSSESIPPALQELPNLRPFIVDPSKSRRTPAALGVIGARAGERLAQRGSESIGVVVVFELTEIDRSTLAALARLTRLGPSAGVLLLAASAKPWIEVVDHCPLGLLAALESRLVPYRQTNTDRWFTAQIDDWQFGELNLLPVAQRTLNSLDRAYRPRVARSANT